MTHNLQPCNPNSTIFTEYNRWLARRLQRPWVEANHSFLSSTEVKIAWIHNSSPLYTARTRCLMKCRNSRKLTLLYLLFWLLVDWLNSSHYPNILCLFKLKCGPIAFAVLVCKRTLKMKNRNWLCIFIGQSLSSLKLPYRTKHNLRYIKAVYLSKRLSSLGDTIQLRSEK